MALSKPLTDELKKDLECSICFQRYQNPRMLPCVHTFCLKCLEMCQSIPMKPGAQFTCPTCRSVVHLPPQGVRGLPGNFFIVNLMEKLDLAEEFSGKAASKCAFCREGNGQIYCMDCKLHLCNTCRPVHSRIPGTNEHIIADASRLSDPQYMKQLTSGQAPRCENHPSEKLKFYCSNCKDLVCRDCMLLSHQSHKCVEARVRAKTAKEALQAMLTCSGMAEKKKQKSNLDQSIDGVHAQSKSVKKEIENRLSEAVNRLQSDAQKLLAEVDMIEKQQCGSLGDERARVESWIEKAENTHKMTQRVLDEDNEWQIIRMEEGLHGAIENLRSGESSYSHGYGGRNGPVFNKSDFETFHTSVTKQRNAYHGVRANQYNKVANLLGNVSSK